MSAKLTVRLCETKKRSIGIECCDSVEAVIDRMRPMVLEDNFGSIMFCNTVRDAIETYNQLQHELKLPDNEIVCLHAKMPFFQRDAFTKKILARLGPRAERKGRLIVSSTQICEQSADIDCDFLASFLCPMDLFFHRLGRLLRFDLPTRPKGCETPRAMVIDTTSNQLWFDVHSKIYMEHTLLKTMELLKERAELFVPRDVQALVDAAYPQNLDPTEQEQVGMDDVELELLAKWKKQTITALTKVLPSKDASIAGMCLQVGITLNDIEENDDPERLSVRQTQATRKIVCLFEKNGKHYLDWDFQIPFDLYAELPSAYADRIELIERLARNSVPIYEYQFRTCSAHKDTQEKCFPEVWDKQPFVGRCFAEIFSQTGEKSFANTGGSIVLHKNTGLSFIS